MKTNILSGKIAGFALIAGILAASSCNDDEKLTVTDTQDIIEEAVSDAYFQDVDDIAAVSISTPTDAQYNGGRVATVITIQDSRFCAGTIITIEPGAESTATNPYGIMTVNFGPTGCTDAKGNIRTGKLIFTYNKWRFQVGSTVVTTTDNYTINGVKLEGTRTLTNVTGSSSVSPKFNVVLENGKATFLADGSVALRASNITWQWVKESSAVDDYLLIDQSSVASGQTRGGRLYSVALAKPLKYKRACGIAVEGIKKYVIDGSKEITIDYGNGTCDKAVVVTVNGITRNLSVD